MEKYDVIDRKGLERADYFYYFMSAGTTIESTVKLDVTAAIERCRKETSVFRPLFYSGFIKQSTGLRISDMTFLTAN